ncbi:hypothetical protein [Streptomyces sp. NPDC058953]|uniref:hypothetical protein n=1 Tax=Streptomyces sp. NPDC058953 TaxID=3346676 RepID=UPI00367D860B
MTIRRNVTSRASAAVALGALVAAGSAGTADNASAPARSSPSADPPHGYVEGARETAEQQSRLLLGDPSDGDVRILDLVTGSVHRSPRSAGLVRLSTDGRFGFLHTRDGVRVVDGGTWTVDHGDHVHYYRAAIRDVGDLPADPDARIRGDAAVTAVTAPDGRARLVDRAALEKGRTGAARTLPGTHTGAVVPYAEHLVALVGGAGRPATAVVYDRAGERVASPAGAECDAPGGDAVTGRGVVFGCADGALLVRRSKGAFTAEKIPYGRAVPAAERAAAFRQRPGGDTLTAPAGERAVWVLDVTERSWRRIATGPVVATGTAGEGSPLLVLEKDGTLNGYDIATGKRISRTGKLLTGGYPAGPGGGGPVIEVDRSRAYVNDPRGRRVHEIDYNDGLRIARSFELDIEPVLMAETGR